jgi:hypothetical protein
MAGAMAVQFLDALKTPLNYENPTWEDVALVKNSLEAARETAQAFVVLDPTMTANITTKEPTPPAQP